MALLHSAQRRHQLSCIKFRSLHLLVLPRYSTAKGHQLFSPSSNTKTFQKAKPWDCYLDGNPSWLLPAPGIKPSNSWLGTSLLQASPPPHPTPPTRQLVQTVSWHVMCVKCCIMPVRLQDSQNCLRTVRQSILWKLQVWILISKLHQLV